MKNLLITAVIFFTILSFSKAPVYGQSMDDDSATLIVYRDGFLYGAWKNFDVKVDGEKMGELDKNKSIHSFQLEPGDHLIAPAKDKKAVDINMSGGTTYIVEYKVRFGLLGAIPKLDIKTVEEGKDDSRLVRESMMSDEMMEDEMMSKN